MKKIFAVLLAIAMVLSLSTVAFAAFDGSITVTNATDGQSYSIYRILDLLDYDPDANSYIYKVVTDWEPFIMRADINGVYVSVDNSNTSTRGNVTWVAEADVNAFAEKALAFARQEDIGPNPTRTLTASGETVTFTQLALGYYLVDSTVGTICSLDTTNKSVDIVDKNEKPTLDKDVKEDSTGEWGKKNNAEIGEVVEFKITVTKQKGAVNYKVHDKMDPGLDFDPESVVVKGPDGTVLTAAQYTLVTEGLTDGCTFELAIDNAYIDTLENGDEIVITYQGKLNENAIIYPGANENEASLKYGDNNDLETTPVITETETYEFELVKTNANGVVLQGAEFKLWADEGKTTEIPVVFDEEDGKYRVATEDEEGVAIVAGDVKVKGLDADIYWLEETKAPTGFNKIDELIRVKMTDDQDIPGNNNAVVNLDQTTNVSTYVSGGVQVINNSGTELPSTGGMGTTLFYIVGAMLVAGAAIILFSRKRMAFAA